MSAQEQPTIDAAFTVCPKCGGTIPQGDKCVLCAKVKPKRRQHSSRWKPVTPRSTVRSAIRLLWLRSRERQEVLKRARYTCGRCGTKASKALGKEVKVEVHHKDGIQNWEKLIEAFYEFLLVSPEHLECLCDACHSAEHTVDPDEGGDAT